MSRHSEFGTADPEAGPDTAVAIPATRPCSSPPIERWPLNSVGLRPTHDGHRDQQAGFRRFETFWMEFLPPGCLP